MAYVGACASKMSKRRLWVTAPPASITRLQFHNRHDNMVAALEQNDRMYRIELGGCSCRLARTHAPGGFPVSDTRDVLFEG